jgi:hypothetical protein
MEPEDIETPENRTTPESPTTPDIAPVSVKPVGTFAAGQSVEGSIPVVVGAEVGSFATETDEETDQDSMPGAA